MENASKALMMAAGVLIGIMILSLGVYVFLTYSQTSKEIHQRIEEQQIEQFNVQYTAYEGREDLTIYDIITVVNNARNNNKYYEDDADKVKVKVTGVTGVSGITPATDWVDLNDSNLNEVIRQDQSTITADPNSKLPEYKCTEVTLENTGRVDSITFEKIVV